MLKNFFLILFIFSFHFGHSQYGMLNTLTHDTCLDKKFSVVFYIVLDSNYTVRSATQPTLAMIIDTLNRTFKHMCVSFVNCSTVFIPNYPYNRWKKNTTDPMVRNNWYTDKTINFYIVDSVKPDPTNFEPNGYAYGPPSTPAAVLTPTDAIVVEQFRMSPPDFFHMFHNIGHFFGLTHTYDELAPTPAQVPGPLNGVVSQEFADETNGSVHGDLLSDTEADPGPVAQKRDGKGQMYIRPLDNYMSIYLTGCHFTQQQFNLMAYNILTKRLYLH